MFDVLRVTASVRMALLSGLLVFGSTLTVQAQEVSEEHLAAAKQAMKATGATERLDKILPEVAAFTKAGLIANRPDIEAEISTIVDEIAISLAARRGPLEDEAAGIYVKLFTEEELQEITEFFSSEAGGKFLRITPVIFRQIDNVSGVWRAGIIRDMNKSVQEKLKEAGLQ